LSYRSETSAVRDLLEPYCVGDGIDVGFGGDPIKLSAICLDLPTPYASTGNHPQHLHGQAFDLPFRDDSLGYVYSSHLIEDFALSDQLRLVVEWGRVARRVVICAPDEQRYREFCRAHGAPRNQAHHLVDFSLSFFKDEVLSNVDWLMLSAEFERIGIGDYSWAVVLDKEGA